MLFHEKIPQNTEIHLKNSATYIYLKLKGRNVKTLVDSGDLDLVRIENKVVKEFDKNWLLAKDKVREAGEKSKELLERKYEEKS